MSTSDEDSEEASGISENSESARPNRWTGAPSTWRSLTEQERGLAASLDELRNRDLSIHLYNAHALKKRAQKIRENQEVKLEEGETGVNPILAEETNAFAPPRSWTAWPLPPVEVPRKDEKIGVDDDDSFTFRQPERVMPSSELEQVLMGITLKFAKERFQARDIASEDDVKENPSEAEEEQSVEASSESEDSATSNDDATRQGLKANIDILRPVVSTNDEYSQKIMRPSIRHTLAKLDEVLMALHHVRKTSYQYVSYSSVDEEEDDDPAQENSPTKRPRGRPRKPQFPEQIHRDSASPSLSIGSEPTQGKPRVRRGRGRPKKKYERLEGESNREYTIRIARLQKKPVPHMSASPEKTRTESQTRRPKGLRDWSEVLGVAALAGFPPAVIARSTQRCANLFGEGMTMMHLIEAPASKTTADRIMRYQPEEMPRFDSGPEETDGLEHEGGPSNSGSRSHKRGSGRGMAWNNTFSCPVASCTNNNGRGFEANKSLLRHLRNMHKLTATQIDDLLVPSDQEMDGAVHVDRFLRPVTQKKGWRGKDKQPEASKPMRSKARPRRVGRNSRDNQSNGSGPSSPSSGLEASDDGDDDSSSDKSEAGSDDEEKETDSDSDSEVHIMSSPASSSSEGNLADIRDLSSDSG